MSRVARGWTQRCVACGTAYESDVRSYECGKCGNLLELVREGKVSRSDLFGDKSQPGIWKFRHALPLPGDASVVSLSEGYTPLVHVARIGAKLGLSKLHVKNEGQNPTGSFKDRGMTVAVSRAVASGAKLLVCASTGNTAASMAAYAARAGVTAMVTVPAGKVASGKMVQATAYGATIVRVDGTFDDALSILLQTISGLPGFSGMNSVNPYRLEGQKSAAFEIYEQLGFSVPDYIILPVGNAGNISAIWKGFKELRAFGITQKVPRMVGVQAEGASPIARAFWKGSDTIMPVESPDTIASAIRIGRPASGKKALAALRESNGMVLTVSDDEITAARRLLSSKEGIFVEPASATPIAALREIGGRLERDAVVVCVATGNGLKDQESIKTDLDGTPLVSDRSGLTDLLERVAIRPLEPA